MAKYQVSWTYTISVEVEADNRYAAFDKAIELEYDFQDVRKTGAVLELCEYVDPEVFEVNEISDIV